LSELSGVALVTGGSRGVGRLIALELGRSGMDVAIAARSPAHVEATARELGGLGVSADVSDRAQVEALVERVEHELGPIDLLVNDAGISGRIEPLWESDPDDWWRVFEVNVLGTYLCCRTVLRSMVGRRSGRIVNVGSGAAYLPPPARLSSAYGPSKAALYRFGEFLANEVAEHGISVFTISPGLVKSEMTLPVFDEATSPWTQPELAPRLVLTLASGRADALSGRYIHAEHDVEDLIERADEIVRDDLNALRLRR
jgi:NAD(P)-dependent dehydrogenase (short-subunit alcohol dehydrogenase family)